MIWKWIHKWTLTNLMKFNLNRARPARSSDQLAPPQIFNHRPACSTDQLAPPPIFDHRPACSTDQLAPPTNSLLLKSTRYEDPLKSHWRAIIWINWCFAILKSTWRPTEVLLYVWIYSLSCRITPEELLKSYCMYIFIVYYVEYHLKSYWRAIIYMNL